MLIATTGRAERSHFDHLGLAGLLLLLTTLAWDASGLDLASMRALGTPAGFAWQHHWLMEQVMHRGVRALSTVCFVAGWLSVLWPGLWRVAVARLSMSGPALARRERLVVMLLVTLSLLAASLVKRLSLTSCPLALSEFGGIATYVSHWHWGVADGGPGRCFPGGHASSVFAWLAVCLPWLAPPAGVKRQAATGWRCLTVIVVLGLLAGGAQTLRGAHHPSHTLWTLLICGAVSLCGWRVSRHLFR